MSSQGPTREPPAGGFLVLIVEDEFLIALDLEFMLTRHGWRVLGPAASVAEALELLRAERPDVATKPGAPTLAEACGGEVRGAVDYRDVTFSYESSAEPVLQGFDLTIPAGTSLAIVGQNGAGKTTLAKLLCRLYDPQGGAIEVDGVDLREFDVEAWRSRVTAVFQDFVRYELPLRDNVAPLGDGRDDDVRGALAEAGATDLVEMPIAKIVH